MTRQQTRGLSIFSRLLIALLGLAVVNGVAMALVFFHFTERTIEAQVREHIGDHLNDMSGDFEVEFPLRLARVLQELSGSVTLDHYLLSSEGERAIVKKELERVLLQSLAFMRSSGYRGIAYVDHLGQEQIVVAGARRVTNYRNLKPSGTTWGKGAPASSLEASTRLFHRLASAPPGTIQVEGPFMDTDGRVSFVAGLAKLDLDTGRLGGMMMIEGSLEKFISSISEVKFFGESPLWVFAPDGRVLRKPLKASAAFDPRPYLPQELTQVLPKEFRGPPTVLAVKEGLLAYDDLFVTADTPLLRVVFTIPSLVLLKATRPIAKFFLMVCLLSLTSVLLAAFLMSTRLSRPIVELAAAADRLGRGDLSARVTIPMSGEVGAVMTGFNQMAERLQKTTVSRDALLKEIAKRQEVQEALARNAAALEQSNAELMRQQQVTQSLLEDLQTSKRQLEQSLAELQATQLQLIQMEKLESVGRLAAGVAHEVKNPLAVIQMGAEYLSKRITGGDGDTEGVLKDIDLAVKRADAVIRGLLDFSAFRELNLSSHSLSAVIDSALLLVQHEVIKTHVTIIKQLAEPLPPVNLDRTKMEQVFVNLFMNALQAMPAGGTLTIRTALKPLTDMGHGVGYRVTDCFRPGDTVLLVEVEDTGIGIPPHQLAKVFDPFFTTKPTGQGTGLGLTVARKIVELHGGLIEIANRQEGGARVTVMLPTALKGGVSDGQEAHLGRG